tara:strand:- start:582 stop:1190 length:609 start_codon:yes stop_codon:yes gene_type:complete
MKPFDAAWQLLKQQYSILTGKPLGASGDFDAMHANWEKETGFQPRKINPDFSNVGVRKVPTTIDGIPRQYKAPGVSNYRPVTDVYQPYMLDTGEALGEMSVYDGNKVGISSIDSDVRRQGLYGKLFRTALQDLGSLSSVDRTGIMSNPFHQKLQQTLPQSMSSVSPQANTSQMSIDYTVPMPPESWGDLQYDVGGLPLTGDY